MTFRITREQAAQELGISTRTIDRYIKGGKLAYKKIANKIFLDEKDIQVMKRDFQALQQHTSTEIVNDGEYNAWSSAISTGTNAKLEKIIDEKIDKFFLVFQEKDRMLEEKNKVIFMLQQRVSELEGKISTMVALPDYNEQKQLATLEKTKLEDKIRQLSSAVRGERTKNSMFLVVFVIAIIFGIFWYLSFVKGWLQF